MKAVIEHAKASSILQDGIFFDTNREIDLSFSQAFRFTRSCRVKTVYERVPYEPSLWKDGRFINFFGDIQNANGFGGVSYNLIKWANVVTAQAGLGLNVKDKKILDAMKRPLDQRGAMVWHDQPRESWMYTPFQKNIAVVPFETTRVPQSWVGKINTFDALFTTCAQNVQMFRDSGVNVPIEVIHWGFDPELFYPVERPQRDVFTFGHMGALSIRKGTDLVVEAFRAAFPKETDVQLICKTSNNTYPFMAQDDRIKVHFLEWSHEELMDNFFKKIDCFVFPTRGEGWGLTPMEAMATGVPAICTNWSGPVEFLDADDSYLLDYDMVPAKEFTQLIYKEDCGDWAEPKKDQLVEYMRHCYRNRNEVKEKGQRAAARIARDFPWEKKIKMYEAALEKHL